MPGYIKVTLCKKKHNTPSEILFKTNIQADVENFMSWYFNCGANEYWLKEPTEEEIRSDLAIEPRVWGFGLDGKEYLACDGNVGKLV